MIIEIREDDCYPSKNPIIKIIDDRPYPTYSEQYNLNSSEEEIDKAYDLCLLVIDRLIAIKEKIRKN